MIVNQLFYKHIYGLHYVRTIDITQYVTIQHRIFTLMPYLRLYEQMEAQHHTTYGLKTPYIECHSGYTKCNSGYTK